MKESLMRESIIREFITDVNTNLKSVEEELIKMSDKLGKRRISELVVIKIKDEIEQFEMYLNKKNRSHFLKLKNSINNYLNDMLAN